jgi:hypothetical protein
MSSPKRAASARARKPAKPARARRKSAAPAISSGADTPSHAAARLAADVERGLARGEAQVLSPEALQALMAALCKSYAAQLEAGGDFMPLHQRSGVSATEIMVTASKLLRAGNLQVFELGMWQSWTGR